NLAQCREAPAPNPSTSRAVTDLVQIVRVRQHERPVVEVEDVELEHVTAEVDCELERRDGVLGGERRRAAMPDPRKGAVFAAKLDHVRLTTTTAQSSASSPRENARQSASTPCAMSSAGRSRCAARTRAGCSV